MHTRLLSVFFTDNILRKEKYVHVGANAVWWSGSSIKADHQKNAALSLVN